jgi:rhodanese-related sulfurtransferase
MKSMWLALALYLSLWLAPPAQAMTLERVGNDLYATGPTVDQDFLSFKEAFAKGGIERLILVNGPGGDLWTGMQVAWMVQSANVKTVVSGFCMSACSLIFMAGQQRAFGTGHLPRVTMVGIHGAHNKDTKQVSPQAMPQMYALYKRQMGDKFDSQVINQALYGIQDAAGFLRMRELQRTQEKDRTPWFCPTGATPFAQCQQFQGKDAFSLGVVTQVETETLTLPQSMQTRPQFFGRALDAPQTDFEQRAQARLEQTCADRPECKAAGKKLLGDYLNFPENKALALGIGKQGYGVWRGGDAPSQAMLGALYWCNHAKNNSKLCRLAAVNEHEVLGLYEEEQARTQELLKTLKPPSQEFIQQEREETGTGIASKLFTGDSVSGMTPKALDGVQRWDTSTMVQALLQDERPVVIDAMLSGPMIPGAINLIHSGLAFEDEKRESEYAQRFRNMLLAAAPDPNKPIVFYCMSSSCALSANAAMRARQLGYSQVAWYRGGIAAWTQAGLPTVGRVPVAVLH